MSKKSDNQAGMIVSSVLDYLNDLIEDMPQDVTDSVTEKLSVHFAGIEARKQSDASPMGDIESVEGDW